MTSSPSPPPIPTGDLPPKSPPLSSFLSFTLTLFLGSGFLSFVNDSLGLCFGKPYLALYAALAWSIMLITGVLCFGLMAFNPNIPKRFFLPISLFIPVTSIGILPLLVYFSDYTLIIEWVLSIAQLLLSVIIIYQIRGTIKLDWPIFPTRTLPNKNFSWKNFCGFFFVGLFLALPSVITYGAFSAKLAVEHFTGGFVLVKPSGIWMQMRSYVRDDGKKIILMPMSHIGETKFYHDISANFPLNSVILMEGVSDKSKLTQTHSDYSKMADIIGAVEQTEVFKPQGEIVAADVDMSSFSPATLELLKTVMLIHSKGVNAETMPILLKPTSPQLEKQLMEDILIKRNHHLLEVIQERLLTSDNIVVPWGAAHMPGISSGIKKLGFCVIEKNEYMALRFTLTNKDVSPQPN